MTAGEKAKRLLRAALAGAMVSAFAFPAAGAQYPPRRATLFDPPPLVALFDVARVPTRAPLDNPDFGVADAAPAAVLLDVGLQRRADQARPARPCLAPSARGEARSRLGARRLDDVRRRGSRGGAPSTAQGADGRLRRSRSRAFLDREGRMARFGSGRARAPRARRRRRPRSSRLCGARPGKGGAHGGGRSRSVGGHRRLCATGARRPDRP